MSSGQAVVVRSDFSEAKVESYAGYKGEETPRAVTIGGTRFTVVSILSRGRVLDSDTGRRREIWRCRLEDGRAVIVERFEGGRWRAYAAT